MAGAEEADSACVVGSWAGVGTASSAVGGSSEEHPVRMTPRSRALEIGLIRMQTTLRGGGLRRLLREALQPLRPPADANRWWARPPIQSTIVCFGFGYAPSALMSLALPNSGQYR